MYSVLLDTIGTRMGHTIGLVTNEITHTHNYCYEQSMDDELGHVPPDFLPLPDLLCFSGQYQLPQHLTYHKTTAKLSPSISNSSSGTNKE